MYKVILKEYHGEGEKSKRVKEVKYKNCVLSISVGQKPHEGEKFIATLKEISKIVDRCTIVVGDTLQRHTLEIFSNGSEHEIMSFSKKQGDLWIERNKLSVDNILKDYEIIRWDFWMGHPEFQEKLEFIKAHYNSSPGFKNAVDSTIKEFEERILPRLDKEVSQNLVYSKCLKYLLEECAGQLLWINYGYEVEIYPAKRNKALQKCYTDFIKDRDINLLRPIFLKFKKKLEIEA